MSEESIFINEEDKKTLKKIIDNIKLNRESSEFRAPVDYIELNLYDYPIIIKEPMDLSTIEENLEWNKYKSIIDVLDDLQKIWDNCKLYNQEFSGIYKNACKLDSKCKKLVFKYFPKIKSYGENNHSALQLKKQSQINYEDSIFKDEERLVEKLRNLNEEQLGEVIELIKINCPKSIIKINDIDSELSIETLNKGTLNILINFINNF